MDRERHPRFLVLARILPAPTIPRPDKIGMMQKMAKMDMKMGAHALKFRPKKDERFEIKAEYGMQMDKMEHSKTAEMDMKKDKPMSGMNMTKDSMSMSMDHSNMSRNEYEKRADYASNANGGYGYVCRI